jgi:hypothetical protein
LTHLAALRRSGVEFRTVPKLLCAQIPGNFANTLFDEVPPEAHSLVFLVHAA